MNKQQANGKSKRREWLKWMPLVLLVAAILIGGAVMLLLPGCNKSIYYEIDDLSVDMGGFSLDYSFVSIWRKEPGSKVTIHGDGDYNFIVGLEKIGRDVQGWSITLESIVEGVPYLSVEIDSEKINTAQAQRLTLFSYLNAPLEFRDYTIRGKVIVRDKEGRIVLEKEFTGTAKARKRVKHSHGLLDAFLSV